MLIVNKWKHNIINDLFNIERFFCFLQNELKTYFELTIEVEKRFTKKLFWALRGNDFLRSKAILEFFKCI